MNFLLFTENLFKEAFSFFASAAFTFFAEGLLKAAENLLLLACKISWRFDVNGHNDVALTLGIVDVNDTLALKREGFARQQNYARRNKRERL